MVDIIGYAAANPIITVIVALVLVVALFYIAKRFGFDPKEILQFIKEFLANMKADDPEPNPEPEPTPVTPIGVEIKTADFFGRGVFTAAVITPLAWEAALGGKGKFEYRMWSDNEALYTVLVNTKDGLIFSTQCMYRLTDNTIVTIVKAGTDPFFPKPEKTMIERYNEMWNGVDGKPPAPCKYMMDEFNRLDVNLCIVFGPVIGLDKYAKYQAGDASTISYVENMLSTALDSAQRDPIDAQRAGCRKIFAVLFNFSV